MAAFKTTAFKSFIPNRRVICRRTNLRVPELADVSGCELNRIQNNKTVRDLQNPKWRAVETCDRRIFAPRSVLYSIPEFCLEKYTVGIL